jgi:hypothetical protein
LKKLYILCKREIYITTPLLTTSLLVSTKFSINSLPLALLYKKRNINKNHIRNSKT